MNMNLEEFMESSKKKRNDPDVDKELDALMNEDEDLKEMMKQDAKANKNKNLDGSGDINLSDLEEDDDKSSLKEEDLDLKANEDEKAHNKQDEIKVVEHDEHIRITKESKEASETEKKTDQVKDTILPSEPVKSSSNEPFFDPYSEIFEKLYNRVDKMSSMGVFEDETSVMNKIIEFKKKHDLDFDAFEGKKMLIDIKKKEIQNMIEFEVISFEDYKKTIQDELKWEEELINFANKDTKVNDDQRKVIIERINKRKEIINGELTQEIGGEEETQPEGEVKEETQKPEETEVNHPVASEEPKNPEETQVNPPVASEEPKATSTSTSTPPKSNLISTESYAPLVKQPPEIVNKKLFEEIKTKLNDYKEAAEYFLKIGSAKQQEDATSKARELNQALKLFEEGKEGQVDEFTLPLGITPAYICNESEQERLNHYSEIIKEFSKRKNELNEALTARVEKLKTIDKKQFAKIKDVVQKDLQERKDKIEFYKKLITKLTESAKNPWVPAPLFSYEEEEEKEERVNEDIDQDWIDVYIGKMTYDKDKSYLQVNLLLGENKTLTEHVYSKEFQKYDAHLKWKLEKSEMKNLFRKYLEVQLYHYPWYWPFKSNLKGTFRLKLEALKESSKISDTFSINLESKRFDPKIDLTIKLRNPIQGKEYNITSKTVMKISKTFPPFRGEGKVEYHSGPGGDNNKQTGSLLTDEEMVSPRVVKKTEVSTPQKKKDDGTVNKPRPQGPEIDSSEFSQEELADPDVIDNLASIKVLEFKIAKYQNEMNKIEGRAPQKLREKFLKAKCKKNFLEQQFGANLTIEQYLIMMNNQLAKDKKLALYFEQQKLIEQGKKVAERIPILIKEIEEAIDLAKKSKK